MEGLWSGTAGGLNRQGLAGYLASAKGRGLLGGRPIRKVIAKVHYIYLRARARVCVCVCTRARAREQE